MQDLGQGLACFALPIFKLEQHTRAIGNNPGCAGLLDFKQVGPKGRGAQPNHHASRRLTVAEEEREGRPADEIAFITTVVTQDLQYPPGCPLVAPKVSISEFSCPDFPLFAIEARLQLSP